MQSRRRGSHACLPKGGPGEEKARHPKPGFAKKKKKKSPVTTKPQRPGRKKKETKKRKKEKRPSGVRTGPPEDSKGNRPVKREQTGCAGARRPRKRKPDLGGTLTCGDAGRLDAPPAEVRTAKNLLENCRN